MKDLIISYDNENGERIERKYDTIMDFLDEVESDNADIPMLDYTNVSAMFFENSFNTKECDTIADLVAHCKNIIR